jgi:hypothetical protein
VWVEWAGQDRNRVAAKVSSAMCIGARTARELLEAGRPARTGVDIHEVRSLRENTMVETWPAYICRRCKTPPDEMRNLALDREKNRETILRMNTLINDLMTKEVGVNDGKFLPEAVRPKNPPLTFK